MDSTPENMRVVVHNAFEGLLEGTVVRRESSRVLVRGIWGEMWFALDALGYAFGEDSLYLDVADRERLGMHSEAR